MDIPQPPPEQELRNIIEKLAQFVARNGPEFEQMTKEKQRDNPKFSFLFAPGEFFNYYQYRVSAEQAAMRSRQIIPPGPGVPGAGPGPGIPGPGVPGAGPGLGVPGPGVPVGGPGPGPGGPAPSMISMPNAPPPPGVWSPAPPPVASFNTPTQEELQMQQQKLQEQIQQSEQNLSAQHQVLMQQQQEQIRDGIKAAQQEHLNTIAMDCGLAPEAFDQVLQPIIDSCTKDSISAGKSWIFNHSDKHENHDFISKYLLRRSVDEENTFVGKLHLIYLINDVLHHCVRKNADELRRSLEGAVVPMFCNACMSASDDQRPKLAKLLKLWESKQQYFDSSVIEKLRNPAQSWQEYEAELIGSYSHVVQQITAQIQASYENYQQQHNAFVNHATQQIQEIQQQQQQQIQQQQLQQQQLQQQQQEMMQQMYNQQQQQQQPPPQHPPGPPQQQFPPPAPPPPTIGPQGWSSIHDQGLPPMTDIFQPPPGFEEMERDLPDITKPPPGWEPEYMSNLPYYELPAGLMCPLVKLEDAGYKPLDPADIRLPRPCPPSERLLNAVEMFYSPPSHDRPRNSEGWEQLALYEYYKAKNAARRRKEKEVEEGLRPKSPSLSPIRVSRSRSRSRSRSPVYRRPRKKSPRRSLSPVPAHLRRPPSPRRSPTPPSFSSPAAHIPADRRLDESNKGHQMLKKMGWKGEGGLGSKGQGIEDPISGGEVRDRGDTYKGVGVNLSDPYEKFRKSKGQAFINRMKARAEERM